MTCKPAGPFHSNLERLKFTVPNLCSRPLNSIGMPYYREVLLSAWPEIISDIGAPPVKFDQSYIATLKATDFGFYGSKRPGLRRNQVQDTRVSEKLPVTGLQAPKFLSEKARESAKGSASAPASVDGKEEDLSNALAEMDLESSKLEVPVMYRTVEIKYSKFGVDDFDFG